MSVNKIKYVYTSVTTLVLPTRAQVKTVFDMGYNRKL